MVRAAAGRATAAATAATILCGCLVLLHFSAAHAQLQLLDPQPPAAADQDDFGAHLVDDVARDKAANPEAKDMESLLHWAIEHSDPDKLRQQAEEVHKQDAVKEFLEKKKRVAELSELVDSQKTEAQMMTEAIAVLTREDASTSEKAAALAELQELVEPIDNANDLKTLGGLQPLFQLLAEGTAPELSEGAAYALGTAASNNAKLVGQLLQDHPSVLSQLLQLAASPDEGAAVKAMYALGSIVRAPEPQARSSFYAGAGLKKLQALMVPSSKVSRKVKAKALNLITDLIEMTASGEDTSLDTFEESVLRSFVASALDLLQQSEALDARERALGALRVLLVRRGAAGRAALEEEGAEAVLREVLTELDLLAVEEEAAPPVGSAGGGSGGGVADDDMTDADRRQYAQYVGHLCADVLHQLSIQHAEL